ncbi:MAG: ABC transporter permease [Alphaproteobacteria bacterium]
MTQFLIIQLLAGLAEASSLFLVASGLTLILGVTRIINLAHGSLYMLGAYLTYSLFGLLGGGIFGFWAAVVLAAVGVGAVGMLIEVTILRPIYKVPEVFQLLATFGVMLIIQDACRYWWGAQDIMGPRAPGLDAAVELFGYSVPEYNFFLIAAGPIVLIFLLFLMHRTRWGILVRAATQDREMAAALGVNERWLFTTVFIVGACLAGLGGAIQVPRQAVNLTMDMNILIEAFIVVIVGGMGSIFGAYLVAILLGVLQAFAILVFPDIAMVLPFLVMAVALVIRPSGLFGRGDYVARAPVGGPEPSRVKTGPIGKIIILAFAVVLIALPTVLGDYYLSVVTEIVIFSLFAMSLHFIMAGGLLSFGHAAYFGLGAYGAAMLAKHLAVPMEPALIAAPLIGGIGGLVFGWFCARLSGVYQGMLSLAFAAISWAMVYQWYVFTGGDNGAIGIWPSDWASSKVSFYYLTLCICGAGMIALRWLLSAPFGFTLRAGRDSAIRCEAIGINVRRNQWAAFTLAGVFAGLAGGVYVYSKGSIFPDDMDIGASLDSLVIILLGGINTLIGPIVGAALFKGLELQLTTLTEYWRLALGVIVVMLVILFPQGIVGYVTGQIQRARKLSTRGAL